MGLILSPILYLPFPNNAVFVFPWGINALCWKRTHTRFYVYVISFQMGQVMAQGV